MIQTADSTRNIYLMKMLMLNNKHVLCPGPTGTGKTQNIFNLLTTQMGENYLYISITFSAQTSANQTQVIILFNLLSFFNIFKRLFKFKVNY